MDKLLFESWSQVLKYHIFRAANMVRPLRIEYPGAVYHVTSRGNARQAIFLSDADRSKFLNL